MGFPALNAFFDAIASIFSSSTCTTCPCPSTDTCTTPDNPQTPSASDTSTPADPPASTPANPGTSDPANPSGSSNAPNTVDTGTQTIPSDGSSSGVNAGTASTPTVFLGYKALPIGTGLSNGWTDYQSRSGCLSIPLKSGGRLDFTWRQIAGLGGAAAYFDAALGSDHWRPAGRGGAFDFLPLMMNDARLLSTSILIRDKGYVRWPFASGTSGSITYYAYSNPIQFRITYNSSDNTVREDNLETRTYFVYGVGTTALPFGTAAKPNGRPILKADSNGNSLFYTYGPNPKGNGFVLGKITGDIAGGMVPYFNYSPITYFNAPITKIYIYNSTNPASSRSIYYTYEQNALPTYFDYFLKNITNPAGCTTGYKIIPLNDNANPTKEQDAAGFTTYFNYDGNFRFNKIIEQGGRVTYFTYTTAAQTQKTLLGRSPVSYNYNVAYSNDIAQISKYADSLGNTSYFGFDWTNPQSGIITDKVSRKIDPIRNLSYYQYNAQANFTTVVKTPISATKQFGYAANGRDLRVTVGFRNAVGFSQLTYFSYDNRRNRTSQMDAIGGIRSFPRDTLGRLYKNVDEIGASTYFNYNSTSGFQQSKFDALLRATYFGYDAYGNRSRVVSPRWYETGSFKTYTTYYQYTTLNQMAKRISPVQGNSYFTYTSRRDLFSSTDEIGTSTLRYYTGRDYLAKMGMVTGPSNAFLLGGNYYLYDYDIYNNRVGITDWNVNRTYFVYDAADRQISRRDALGNITYFGYDNNNNLTVTLDARQNRITQFYDLLSRKVQITDAVGSAYYGYDADNNMVVSQDKDLHRTTMQYDPLNRRISTTNPAAGVMYYVYDGVGNVIRQRDPNANTTTFSYDVLRRQHRTTDAVGNSTYYNFDNAGNLRQTLDPRNNPTYFIFDPANRRIGINDALNDLTYFGYDLKGNLVKNRDARNTVSTGVYDPLSRRATWTDPSGIVYFGYDNNDNPVKFRNQLSNSWTTTYDGLNRPILQIDPLNDQTYFGYDQVSNLVKISDPLTNRTITTYDPINRPTNVSDPTNGQTYFGYDPVGNLIKYRDPNTNTTTFKYDVLNRLANVSDPLQENTYFTYDANNNLIQVMDPLAHSTAYSYDADNRLVSWTDPLSNQQSYLYDASSNFEDGFYRTVIYDQLNRKHAVLVGYGLQEYGVSPYGSPEGTSIAQQYFNYDQVGNLTSMVDNWGSSSFTYDTVNRLIGRINPNGDRAYFTYDGASNLTGLRYPQGTSFATSTYDSANRLSQIISPASHLSYYTYNAASLVNKKRFGNKVTCYYGYDASQRVTNIQHISSASTTIAGLAYRRDLAGRINRIVRENSIAIYYQYDSVNRLTSEIWSKTPSAAQIYAFTYKYDKAGNRQYQNRAYGVSATSFEKTYYQYNVANEVYKRYLVTNNTSTYYVHDIDGSILRVVDQSNNATYFQYDQNRLITAIIPPSPNVPWSFVYDGLLNRVKIVKGSTPSYFLWTEMNQLEERTTGSVLIARYTQGSGIVPGIGSIMEVQRPIGTLTYFQYLHMDHQGSVQKVTDASQNVLLAYTNDAFGRQIVPPTGTHLWLENDFQFQSNWMTFSIGGQTYCMSPSRAYDPVLGRFLQRDPLPNLSRVARSPLVKSSNQKITNRRNAFKVIRSNGQPYANIIKNIPKFGKLLRRQNIPHISLRLNLSRPNFLGIYSKSLFSKHLLITLAREYSGTNLYEFSIGNPINILDPSGYLDAAECKEDLALMVELQEQEEIICAFAEIPAATVACIVTTTAIAALAVKTIEDCGPENEENCEAKKIEPAPVDQSPPITFPGDYPIGGGLIYHDESQDFGPRN
jgi:YD repeat-containing protein